MVSDYPTDQQQPPRGLREALTRSQSLGEPSVDLTPLMGPDAPQTPEEQRKRQQQIQRRVAEDLARSNAPKLEATKHFRVIVCWRIVRFLGRTRGMVAADQPLHEALDGADDNPDPWTRPIAVTRFPMRRTARTMPIVHELAMAEDHQRTYADPPAILAGLAFQPPPPSDEGFVYDPAKDQLLWHWIQMCRYISNTMGLQNGSPANALIGQYGLHGLFDPYMVRDAFCEPHEIMYFEHVLIEATLDLLIDNTTRHTLSELKEKFGLAPEEAQGVLAMARATAEQCMDGTVEEARSMMLLRLEDYLHRCREACNMREEIAALKQMSIILGLADAEKESTQDDFVRLVENTARERKQLPRPENDQ